jgi:hypothetical protein
VRRHICGSGARFPMNTVQEVLHVKRDVLYLKSC